MNSATMNGSTEVQSLIDELIAAWNAHDVDRVIALYDGDYEGQDVGEAQRHRGRDSVRRSICGYFHAFPDICLQVESVKLCRNEAVLIWSALGTHRGMFMKIPPTGREVCIHGISVLTIEAGLLRRGLQFWDVAGFLRTINLLPEL